MSFIEGFYSFNMEITNSDRELYRKLRIKTPRHPDESDEYFYARILTYIHAGEEGLEFTEGLFNNDQPILWKKDFVGELLRWVYVGCPSRELLQRYLRRAPGALFSIYFFEPEQVQEFCHAMRGSTNNWVKEIKFFQISPSIIQELIPLKRSSSSWQVTIVDDYMYLTVDSHQFETEVQEVNIWQRYQEYLKKAESED